MKAFSKEEVTAVLAKAGYRTNPKGIVALLPVEFTPDDDLTWIDINADAVRKGDVVPARPSLRQVRTVH